MRLILLFYVICSILYSSGETLKNDKKNLYVTITNIKGKGVIRSGLYKPTDNFLKYTPIGYTANSDGKDSVVMTISDLEYGEYALVLFFDQNGDEKLNTKIFGIPTEAIGFSNNIKPFLSAPKFERCKFLYNDKNNCIVIKLIYY